MTLPLHVFEPRYRKLLEDVHADGDSARFGVVALRSGSEVESGLSRGGSRHQQAALPDLAEVGTIAEIMEAEPFEDGSTDLLTVGSRRFRVIELLAPDPYLRARVEWLPERSGELHDAQVELTYELCSRHAQLLLALSSRRRNGPVPKDPNLLSYHVAAHLPLPLPDRQRLLEQRTTAQRLELALTLLRREISLLRATRSICVPPEVLQLDAARN